MTSIGNISSGIGTSVVAPSASLSQSNQDGSNNAKNGMAFRGGSKLALSILTLDIFLLLMDLLMGHKHTHHHAASAYGALNTQPTVPSKNTVV